MGNKAFIVGFVVLLLLLAVLVLAGGGVGLWRGAEVSGSSAAPVALSPDMGVDAVFGAQEGVLSNGMPVVVIPNHRAPVVTHMVWYRVGATDEATGKTGLAHFLEHLMFKGSENVPSGEFSRRVRALGGNDNAFTAQDFTAYFQTVAVQHLETVMTMEADRMRGILLPADEFESERAVVLEERRQTTENDPRSHFFEQLRHALFPGHPYGAPVIGWEADIRALTPDDARDWHARWYAPNNAILVISGDITLEAVLPLAERIYGTIPPRTVPDRPALPPVGVFPGRMLLSLEDQRLRQGQYIRLYRVPGMVEDRDAALALDVAQEMLAGNASTRFYQSMVVARKLATHAVMASYTDVRGTGTFYIGLTPADGVSFDDLDAALEAELNAIADAPVDADALAAAKTRLIDGVIFATDSLSGPAHIFGRALVSGLSVADVETWPRRVAAINGDQVRAALRRYVLDNRAYVTGHIHAAGGVRGGGE